MAKVVWFTVCLIILVAVDIIIYRNEKKLFQDIVERLEVHDKAIKILRRMYQDLIDDRK